MLTKRGSSKSLRWQHSRYSPLGRQWEVSLFTFQFLLFILWDKFLRKNSSKQRQKRAKWLVKNLLQLGPTFIKIGQSLSTRADLIPLEYIQELSQLQDNVPPFSTDEAIAVIEGELGKPVYDLFDDFEIEPLASASLGQVHRAKLYTGKEVVVKVQRPGLEKIFNLDFEVVHRLIRILTRFFKSFKKYNLEAVHEEFFEILFREIDYVHEGKNAERFRTNFRGYSQIKVPKIHWKYSTKKILTLEYLPGIKVDDRAALEANNINLDNIIKLGICSYLKQLLIDGFFQSDPHPGNMAVSQRGELIFYDFGTMAEVKTFAKDQMIQVFFAVLKKDTDTVVDNLVYMGLIEPLNDMTPVKRIVAFLLENFREKPVDVRAFEQVSDEVYSMFKSQPFRLPPQMTFILKSLTTLDGIARALDPQYNLLAASQPFVKNLALSGSGGSVVTVMVRQAKEMIKSSLNQSDLSERFFRGFEERIDRGELQFRVRSLENERVLKRINLGIRSLIYACLTGFVLLSASILMTTVYTKFALICFGFAGLFSLFFFKSLISLLLQEKVDKLLEK
ncbi:MULTISPECIES: ABC1 kinase family protein [Crocosphaera]|uniref:Ubiquinone biosynthesis monooxygenase UbiB n=1 Tax=Crocosphaera watsonii WH 0005 TaxID=423472 RepID=T2IMV3_CROWT|nr:MULTISPECIES: AarF/ABC1/UbiB kinase family protein [Crocosphaera]NQZ61782.1 AarF/ABC1/UbiB kinase family protein [Crocosphaera sp.]CCQ54122.1 Ubiquinone biosynthesis monooxygenase UbiB [Crocosphaera watsonii WH 0005]